LTVRTCWRTDHHGIAGRVETALLARSMARVTSPIARCGRAMSTLTLATFSVASATPSALHQVLPC
jgi:hypothetical protein